MPSKNCIAAKCFCAFLILALTIPSLSGCSNDDISRVENSNSFKSDKPKVTIGIQVSPAMALVMVAKDKNFFADEGVDVEIKEFTAGKFALQAFLGGNVDFAISGEVPACLAVLQANDIRVVCQVVEKTVNEVRIVALKDEHAVDAKTYFSKKKRKLSTSFGGGPEMFTYAFLKHNKIDSEDVELISQKPEDMPAALNSRSVDAIAIFDPFAYIAETRMRDDVVTFTASHIYSELYVLDARPEQIKERPENILAILRGLKKAGEFIAKDPEASKEIVRKYTKLDRSIIDGIWNNFVFKPALTKQLVEYWEAEAEWAKDTGKVPRDAKVPDFRTIIDRSFMETVAPEAITLEEERLPIQKNK